MVGGSGRRIFFTGEKKSTGDALDQAELEREAGEKIVAGIRQIE